MRSKALRLPAFIQFLICGVLLSFFAGCTGTQRYNLKENAYTPFKATNSYCIDKLPDEVIRVAVLPVYSDKLEGGILDNIDETFKGELIKKNRFEVVPISRQQLSLDFHRTQFSSVEVLPTDFFGKLEGISGSNALLFIDITQFNAYKPVALGVRCKLVDIKSGEILWAFDTLFDSGNPIVAVAARRFQLGHQKTEYPLDSHATILKSPNRFAQYVASDAFDTIPLR